MEHATGLARTLRIDVDPDASLVDLVSALNDLAIVEQAVAAVSQRHAVPSGRGPRPAHE